jgi:hypothetical protein
MRCEYIICYAYMVSFDECTPLVDCVVAHLLSTLFGCPIILQEIRTCQINLDGKEREIELTVPRYYQRFHSCKDTRRQPWDGSTILGLGVILFYMFPISCSVEQCTVVPKMTKETGMYSNELLHRRTTYRY